MSINSYPNSDCKQFTESKLGWVHYAHTQNPGRAHIARAVPRSWALLRAHQAGRAHVARTASAGRVHAGCALVATRPCSLPPSRDLTSMSRHQGSQNHVATSNRCRYTTQTTPCRDIKSVSRNHPGYSMSRHKIGVATSFLLPSPIQVATSRPGRNLPGDEPMSRHHFHVATSFLPTVGFPGRDLPHSRPCHDAVSAQQKQTRSRRH